MAMSLRVRLTIWYTAASLVLLCLFAAAVLWNQRQLSMRRLDRDLDGMAATVTDVLGHELRENNGVAYAAERARRTILLEDSVVLVLDAHGAVLASSRSDFKFGRAAPTSSDGPQVWTEEAGTTGWRIHAVPQTFDGTAFVIVVASSLKELRREQQSVVSAIELAIPLVLLLAGGGGLWLASAGLRPIAAMAQRATQIPLTGMEDLGETARTDELGQLARAFNGLVARLRTAIHTQQQLMADASHELRTPVSVMRAASEVALSQPTRPEAEYRESLTIVGDQARRLTRLVDNMLVLARADAGGYPLRPVDVYLDEVVGECCLALRPLSAERQVSLHVAPSGEVPFKGDEDLLRQLLLNVLQNAVQHTPPGGCVSTELTRNADGITIRVSDTGHGIPPAEQERIFDRFVQLDTARRGQGSGLGLPIARWIAEAHRGTLVLERSGPTGSTFRIALPAT
jgi:signal transduction histidine kinase